MSSSEKPSLNFNSQLKSALLFALAKLDLFQGRIELAERTHSVVSLSLVCLSQGFVVLNEVFRSTRQPCSQGSPWSCPDVFQASKAL